MARSRYIYLVVRDGGIVLGGFTVKYEAQDFAAQDCHEPMRRLRLERLDDGVGGEPELIDWGWDKYIPNNHSYKCVDGPNAGKFVKTSDLKDGSIVIDHYWYQLKDGQLHNVGMSGENGPSGPPSAKEVASHLAKKFYDNKQYTEQR